MLLSLLLLGCNGGDDAKTETGGADADGDGFVDRAVGGDDCDDSDPAVNPDAAEVCDPDDVDEDCDSLTDDGDDSVSPAALLAWYPDGDSDGFGDTTAEARLLCDDPGDGAVADGRDCDDGDAAVNPDAQEVCDELDTDEDCDGLIDDSDSSVDPASYYELYVDGDEDGYGSTTVAGSACDPSAGESWYSNDCDDADAAVSPGADEVCDAADRDEDCDGDADDDDRSTDFSTGQNVYPDEDGDGWGTDDSVLKCGVTAGYASQPGDCDDERSTVNPDGLEVCDNADLDEDCDGDADDDDSSVDPTSQSTWYLDSDNDDYGAEDTTGISSCEDPSSGRTYYAPNAADCDDSDRLVNPGADEECDNETDDDCDDLVDDADTCYGGDTGIALLWYAGGAEVDTAGDFQSGYFGYDVTDLADLPDFSAPLCTAVGDWTESGTAPSGCPDCDWSFQLLVDGTVADGDYCDQLGIVDGTWDGFDGGWGFAESYEYTAGRYTYTLDTVVFYYFGSPYNEWYFLAYNYGGYGYNTGDAESMTFHAYAAAYYFYP